MSESKKSDEKKSGEVKVPPKTWIVWIIILAFIPVLMFLKDSSKPKFEKIDYNRLMELVENDQIIEGVINYDPQNPLREISGRYRIGSDDVTSEGTEESNIMNFQLEIPLDEEDQKKLLKSNKFTPIKPNTMLLNFLYTLLPFLFLAALIYFFFIRQIKMAGKGAMSFGKSRARLISKEKNKTNFKDVAGVEEAKEEVSELVEFLKDPKKFQKLGGKIPKGVLMIGPPGTGKTLLAKAIAGEADADFFNISGSDFVEMFVGVGASRVRDMFEQARKNTPCLIFIDEIDAVGRSRGHGLGGGNDEREQTLNALLAEMDGFDSQEGVIIIAATNRPDVLDPALLRPGRFDRHITVNLPDIKGREAILKVHSKNVKLGKNVNLSVIARGTPGFSGAELANLLNEAALIAVKANKRAIGMPALEEARDKVKWGRERRSLAMTDEDKKFTAWHEAGHALVNVILEHTHPLHKVTIIPRGQTLGSTMSLPKEDVFSRRKKEMMDMIAVTMAGRIAEEIVSDDISTGAAGDIQQATTLARSMVCEWGMSHKIGMVQYGDNSEYIFLGRDIMRGKEYSERIAQEIDEEVKRLIDHGYHVAKDIIEKHRDKLEVIAESLLEYETLDGDQVREITETGRFTPPSPPATDSKDKVEKTKKNEKAKKVPPKLDPGELGSPAPAAI